MKTNDENTKNFYYHGMTNKASRDIDITKDSSNLCTPDEWYECFKADKCLKAYNHKKRKFQQCEKIHISIEREQIGVDYDRRCREF